MISRKFGLSKPDISCQNHGFKHFNLKCIYPISYEIAKRQTPEKRICPIDNCTYAIRAKMSDISQIFEMDDIFTRKDAISGILSPQYSCGYH